MRAPLWSFICLLVLPSCTTVSQHFRERGVARASFDLACPAEQLEAMLLNRPRTAEYGVDALGAQVGVVGCGKQAVYVLEGDPHRESSWSWRSDGVVQRR